MTPVLLSIIICTRNASASIERCLQSVSNAGSNVEILLQDGASEDNTVELAERFRNEATSIHIISQPDKGIYEAMNKAITRSMGEWCWFLGADDYALPGAVSVILNRLANPKELMHVCRVYNEGYGIETGYAQDWKQLFHTNICQQGILYHRSLFRRLGNFQPRFKAWADWEFNLRCRYAGITPCFHDAVIAHFSRGGLSSTGDPRFAREHQLIHAQLEWKYAKGLSKLVALPSFVKAWLIVQKKDMKTRTTRFYDNSAFV